jgi:hypothetical protein
MTAHALALLLAAAQPATTTATTTTTTTTSTTTTTAAVAATEPAVIAPPLPQDEFTAFAVRGGQLKLGVLSFDLGLTDWWSIGTDPPAWAVRAVGSVIVPNLHTELVPWRGRWSRVSVLAAGYYIDLSRDSGADGQVVSFPLSLFVSLSPGRWTNSWTWLHLEGNYNFVRAFGTGATDRADIEGTVATRSLQLGAMLEQRVWRGLCLSLRGRLQAWTTPLVLEGEATFDPFTRAEIEVELRPAREHPWAAVAAASYSWRHVQLRVGVGYGSYFVPGANVVAPYFGIIPDAAFAVYF